MAPRDIMTTSNGKSILNSMNSLRKSNVLCDVTLRIDNEDFPAHRIVLAACSDYFCALFTNELEKDQPRVDLEGLAAPTVEILLDFMYTETVYVSVDNVQELLSAACLLQLQGMKQTCCEFLESQIDPSNCLAMRDVAEAHNCLELQQGAELFIQKFSPEEFQHDECCFLEKNGVDNSIYCDDIRVMCPTRARGIFGPVPAWLESQDLTAEALRAVVVGLGNAILTALCVYTESSPVRNKLDSLSLRKFTPTMYAALCHFMDSCFEELGLEQLVVPESGKDAESGGSAGDIWMNMEEDDYSVVPEEEERDPEDGEEVKPTKTFTCSWCSQNFTTKGALRMHMEAQCMHSCDKKYKCNVCPYSTCNKRTYTAHTRVHTGEKPFTCNVCGKKFSTSSYCQIHMRIHTGERPYTCKVCTKTFSNSSTLQKHTRIHTGEKPYICSVCGKGFRQKSHCQIHMRVHTGERPYTCTVCSKAFSDSSALRQHARIHTGERPYTCKVCAKTFSDSSTLRQHARIHMKERPCACTVCAKKFSDSSLLQDHSQVHGMMSPYMCTVCGKGFISHSNCKRHMNIHL
uniref:GDNF-inducible zinc finger protein 1-like isoform X1 n=2 Tax=Myxine glutinosa TaxID=7769 RepID=UPI0035901FDB